MFVSKTTIILIKSAFWCYSWVVYLANKIVFFFLPTFLYFCIMNTTIYSKSLVAYMISKQGLH